MPGVRSYGRGVAIALPGATATYGHTLHLLYVVLTGRGRPAEEGQDPGSRPPVTAVPAYRGAFMIGNRLDEMTHNGRPGPLEISPVADGPTTADSHRPWLPAEFGVFSSGSDPPGGQNTDGRSSRASSPPAAELAVNRAS